MGERMWRKSIKRKNVLRERNGRERIELRKNRTERKIFHRGRETERRREIESGGVSNSKIKIKNYFFVFIFLQLLKN